MASHPPTPTHTGVMLQTLIRTLVPVLSAVLLVSCAAAPPPKPKLTDELSEEPLKTQPDLEPPVEYERSEKTSKGTLRFDGPQKINSLEVS